MSYDPKGIFRQGFTKAEVETILDSAKEVFLTEGGSQVVSWSSSGHQATSRLALPADHLIAECVFALELLDPDNYPAVANRTQVSFTPHEPA